MLKQAYPTRQLIALELFEREDSMTPLNTQVEHIASYIRAVVGNNSDAFSNGYDFVGHSMGGLLMRAVIETMDDHDVNTFISLAGVQMGAFCPHLPCGPLRLGEDMVSQLYTPELQASSSFANLYHDPHFTSFLQGNKFLPALNGLLDDVDNQRRKSNFLRLKRAVFIGSDDDGIVVPAASQFFEFVSEENLSEIVPLQEQAIYRQDTFGLRTLDEDGRLSIIRVPGVQHRGWITDPRMIQLHILPLLGVSSSVAEGSTFPKKSFHAPRGLQLKYSFLLGIAFFFVAVAILVGCLSWYRPSSSSSETASAS